VSDAPYEVQDVESLVMSDDDAAQAIQDKNNQHGEYQVLRHKQLTLDVQALVMVNENLLKFLQKNKVAEEIIDGLRETCAILVFNIPHGTFANVSDPKQRRRHLRSYQQHCIEEGLPFPIGISAEDVSFVSSNMKKLYQLLCEFAE
jgi:hypothetical protein